MEKRESRVMIEDNIKELLTKHSGVQRFEMDAGLEWDIGLTGDDAFEFILEFGKVYNVDVSGFPFHEYFHDEGEFMLFMFRKLIRKNKKKKFTIENLLRAVEIGKLL